MIYSFSGFDLDTDRVEVRAQGGPVHVEPQVFDVLRYLIEHRDRMVSKGELFEQIWGGAFVGEAALTSRIKTARQAVGDSGREQRVIRTVHGRGYQFVAEVAEHPSDTSAGSVDRAVTESPIKGPRSPSGTVTFLFTDIERSSRLWEQHPDAMAAVVPRHDELLRRAIAAHAGRVFATGGDGLAAVFDRVRDAVDAAADIRAALDAEAWPEPIVLRVRIGLHTGEALEVDGDYLGSAVNRAARVMAMAHGGQTLLSDVTAEVLADRERVTDLGICNIDPAMPPLRLWQLGGPPFPPLIGTVAAAPPLMRTAMIGRESDLERVVDLIGHSRLVSITGPGGAGKTTLALATANAVLASFPAGVAFVELAAAGDAGDMVRAIAEAAGIQGGAAVDRQSLAAHLARRSILVVLDNCEHLLDECAAFVDQILDTAPAARILATTREPLGADGEVVHPLLSLAGHAPDLFVVRAAAIDPVVDLTPDDPRVIDICRRLDGLPLAIELAAAQLRHLGIDQLHSLLADGLDLSSGGRTRGRERHVTLDRTIAWSYDLLDESGRSMLRQLGVFPGSFDLHGAEAVGMRDRAGTLASISDLVAKNLLVRRADSGRFQLLETIRSFAQRRLHEAGEADEARARLRRYVVDRATAKSRTDRWFSGSNAATLRADLDSARFAFEQSLLADDLADALEILIDGSFLWRNAMSCADARRWIGRLDARVESLSPHDRMWLALMRADLGQGMADHRSMSRAAEEAIALADDADDDTARVIALHFDALAHIVANPDVAARRLGDAQSIARAVGDRRLIQLLEAFAVLTAIAGGEFEEGAALSDELAARVAGDGYEVFIANWVAWVAHLIIEDAAGLRHWTDRQRDYLAGIGVLETWLSIWSMALSSAMEGEDVNERLHRARLRADREDLESAADTVLALAVIARFAGRPSDAAELLGAVTGQPLNNIAHYVLYRALRRSLGSHLGADARDGHMRRGATLTLERVLDEHGLSITRV